MNPYAGYVDKALGTDSTKIAMTEVSIRKGDYEVVIRSTTAHNADGVSALKVEIRKITSFTLDDHQLKKEFNTPERL